MSLDGLDAWKTDAPELDDDAPTPCPICTNDQDAAPCSESCAHLVDVVAVNVTVRGLYEACRRAMGLARQYRDEERVRGRKSRRLEAVMQQIGMWREDVRLIRAVQRRKAA